MNRRGFALIEVLVALTVLSIVIIPVLSSVSAAVNSIHTSKAYTKAIIIAKQYMNEFISSGMRSEIGPKDEAVKEYEGYKVDMNVEKFEHPLIPNVISAKKAVIDVKWVQGKRKNKFQLIYIYALQ